MEYSEKHTAYQPTQTTTTTATWSEFRIVNPKCYRCVHSGVMHGKLVCGMASRTMMHGPYGDTCMSYLGRDAR